MLLFLKDKICRAFLYIKKETSVILYQEEITLTVLLNFFRPPPLSLSMLYSHCTTFIPAVLFYPFCLNVIVKLALNIRLESVFLYLSFLLDFWGQGSLTFTLSKILASAQDPRIRIQGAKYLQKTENKNLLLSKPKSDLFKKKREIIQNVLISEWFIKF